LLKMPGKPVVIIIPVYKQLLNDNELLSLKQCIRILKNYPIIFIGPPNLNTSNYEQECKDKVPFKFMKFDDACFSGINGYNKLMLSASFYKTFLEYKYMLIYQLDAYVFKDELGYWCKQNYDYIGAPNIPHANREDEIQFLKRYEKFIAFANRLLKTDHQISNVGNGGFSLRKINTCYWLLKILNKKAKNWGNNNEDGFFKYWGNLLYPLFKLPTDETALHFSIEVSPRESYAKIGHVLPFGCHAFERYEPEFWEQYIRN